MGLENSNEVDAVGIEIGTGNTILSILDGWDWDDLHSHLLALQSKLNAYLNFIEEGQLEIAYPKSIGRDIVIDVVTRYPLHAEGARLLARASEACKDMKVEIRSRNLPGSPVDDGSQS